MSAYQAAQPEHVYAMPEVSIPRALHFSNASTLAGLKVALFLDLQLAFAGIPTVFTWFNLVLATLEDGSGTLFLLYPLL